MTLDQVLKLRAEDALRFNREVARVVFGFDGKRPPKGWLWWDTNEEGGQYARLPDFANDLVADYHGILKHVRQTWEPKPFLRFLDDLRRLQHARIRPFMKSRKWNVYPDGNRSEVMYEPGDYATAALASAPPPGVDAPEGNEAGK